MTGRFAYGADTIEIIDSVPEDHSQTACHLEQHIEDLKDERSVAQIPVTRRKVVTATALYAELSQVATIAVEKNLWPLLHIETHGGNDELRLAGCDVVNWADLQPYLMALNKATTDGSLHQPPGLGHLLYQERFGFCGGGVLRYEAGEQGLEGVGVFARNDDTAGGEPVLERVTAGVSFTFRGAGSGGTWFGHNWEGGG